MTSTEHTITVAVHVLVFAVDGVAMLLYLAVIFRLYRRRCGDAFVPARIVLAVGIVLNVAYSLITEANTMETGLGYGEPLQIATGIFLVYGYVNLIDAWLRDGTPLIRAATRDERHRV